MHASTSQDQLVELAEPAQDGGSGAPLKAQLETQAWGGKGMAGSSGVRAAARLARALKGSSDVPGLSWARCEELRARLSVLRSCRKGKKLW
eukprot:14712423-Alexandrium_andersonii.AAC.1